MDKSLLMEKGFHPFVIGPAVLNNFRIHIGERATLIPDDTKNVWGIVMELDEKETQLLYSEASVRDYQKTSASIKMIPSGATIHVYFYVLPERFNVSGSNPAYANKLLKLVRELKFDSAYIKEIEFYTKTP